MRTNSNNGKWSEPSCPSEICLKNTDDVAMPELDEIPAEFENKERWLDFQSRWFEDGIEVIGRMTPRENINASVAFAHLSAIQNAFAVSCQRRRMAVAWLASIWFIDWTSADDMRKEMNLPA